MPNQDVSTNFNTPDADIVPNQSSTRQHSLTGIASSIIGVIDFSIFALSAYLSFRGTPFRLIHSLELAGICIVPFLWATGIILAVIGLFRKKDRKLYPVLGLVINLLYICPLALTIFGFFVGR